MKKSVAYALTLAVCATGALCVLQSCTGLISGSVRREMVAAPLRPDSAPPSAAHPSPYNFASARGGPVTESARILADNKVTFQFRAPDAQKVQVSIASNNFDMNKGADGVWTYTTAEPQAPGFHNYWLVVDGVIVLDPYTEAFIGYSHMCNGFEVPEPGVSFYDIKDVPHGKVLSENYFAKTTNTWRHIVVYTPPGYDDNAFTRYPVLYLQHGGGEDERVWTVMGRTNVILDNLLAEGKVKPMIVVMETSAVDPVSSPEYPGPMGSGGRVPAAAGAPGAGGAAGRGAGAPGAVPGLGAGAPGAATAPGRGGAMGGGAGGMFGGTGSGPYGEFMVKELIPYVDSHFRTLTDKDHRAMAGLSMGGGQTARVTMNNLDKFAYIGLFSGGTASGGGGRGGRGAAPGAAPATAPATAPALDLQTIYSGAMKDPAEFNKKVKVFFFSCGTVQPLENPEALKRHQEQLVAAGITNSYCYISPGTSHEWQTWRRSLYTFAPLLFRD